MASIGIFFGSTTGNTEAVANKIEDALDNYETEVINVADASAEDLQRFDYIILGASTWGIGELQDDMDEFLPKLETSMYGKKAAIFGLGDAEEYPDSFADSIGCLYDVINDKAEVVGKFPTTGYNYSSSAAEIDEGTFAGLPLDEDNESKHTDKRIKKWVALLNEEFK
ncbi:MAG: flavodoxin [Bacteroidales bacterium]